MKEIQQQINSFGLLGISILDVSPLKVAELLKLKKKCALMQLEYTIVHSVKSV